MILPVNIIGSSVLRQKAVNIDKEYKKLSEIIDDMFKTMYQSDGVGLAAPQVGKAIKLFVIDASPMAEEDAECEGYKKVFINAEILDYSDGKVIMNEGCLSLPGVREDITRSDTIHIKYYDENFVMHEEELSGFRARVVQHEYDHTQGILFTDRLASIKKTLIKNKLKAIANGKFKAKYKVRLADKKVKNVFA